MDYFNWLTAGQFEIVKLLSVVALPLGHFFSFLFIYLFIYFFFLLAIGGYCDSEFLLCVCVSSSLVRFLLFGSPLKSWKFDYNQTWVKDAIGVPSYVIEILRSRTKVKGHLRSSSVENVSFCYLSLL